jgi:hypothetical protein
MRCKVAFWVGGAELRMSIQQSDALLGVAGLAYLQVEIPKYNENFVLGFDDDCKIA